MQPHVMSPLSSTEINLYNTCMMCNFSVSLARLLSYSLSLSHCCSFKMSSQTCGLHPDPCVVSMSSLLSLPMLNPLIPVVLPCQPAPQGKIKCFPPAAFPLHLHKHKFRHSLAYSIFCVLAGLAVEGVEQVDEVGGTALRLLHQLAASRSAAEAISRAMPTAAMPLMAAMSTWGLAGSVLALETVKRAIVLDNLSRDLLIGPLLASQLLQKLLQKLDWQQGGHSEVLDCITRNFAA